MSEKRITVWVQRFKDRDTLMLQWTDPDTGKRKSKSAGTADEGEAEKQRADLEYELNHGLHEQASALSWEKFRDLFEEEYVSNLRPKSRGVHSATLDLFEELCRPKLLRSVSERTVSRFVASMRQKPTCGRIGMASSTIRVRLEFLHTALAWAAEQRLIPGCPKFPTVKAPKKKPQPVPAESFERMLAKAPDQQTRAYLLAGWLAGLRLSEALALEREPTTEAPYLDPDNDRIVFPAEFVKAVEDQWVPLDPTLREALEALPRHGKKVFRFISRQTGGPLSVQRLSARIGKLAKAAGVKLTMKSLRKGFGCRYAGKVPAQVLQKLMRHGSISTTMDYYANVDDAVMDAVLGPKRNSSRNSGHAVRKEATGDVDANSSPDAVCTDANQASGPRDGSDGNFQVNFSPRSALLET
jgi:integrase